MTALGDRGHSLDVPGEAAGLDAVRTPVHHNFNLRIDGRITRMILNENSNVIDLCEHTNF